jgi:hypothetical protein
VGRLKNGEVDLVIAFEMGGDTVSTIRLVRNPAKLRRVGYVSGMQ